MRIHGRTNHCLSRKCHASKIPLTKSLAAPLLAGECATGAHLAIIKFFGHGLAATNL